MLLNAFLIFAPQSVTMAGKATFKPNISSCSSAKQAITVHTGQKRIISSIKWTCQVPGNVDRNALEIIAIGVKLIHHWGYGCCIFNMFWHSPWWSMDASCTGKAPARTRWRSTHCGLSSPPRISIQWAVIVKYSFMHLECHRSHVKAGFASFQLLSLLNFLIPSAYKLDICKSIQRTSQKTLQ